MQYVPPVCFSAIVRFQHIRVLCTYYSSRFEVVHCFLGFQVSIFLVTCRTCHCFWPMFSNLCFFIGSLFPVNEFGSFIYFLDLFSSLLYCLFKTVLVSQPLFFSHCLLIQVFLSLFPGPLRSPVFPLSTLLAYLGAMQRNCVELIFIFLHFFFFYCLGCLR